MLFVAIAVVWLIYLVPLFLHRSSNGLTDEVDPAEPITEAVTIVRRGVPLSDDEADEPQTVSTPMTRRAALHKLHLVDRRAALRRSVVVGALLAATAGLAGLAGIGRLAWPVVGLPVAGLGVFLAVARVTVVRMRADLDAQAREIWSFGDDSADELLAAPAEEESSEASVDLGAPVVAAASLLEPIPVTAPTYVSKPLAPRTVRTIDLSAPVASGIGGIPVTADAPASLESAFGLDRAVGE